MWPLPSDAHTDKPADHFHTPNGFVLFQRVACLNSNEHMLCSTSAVLYIQPRFLSRDSLNRCVLAFYQTFFVTYRSNMAT